MIPPPPRSTLFPYTTLFRSLLEVIHRLLARPALCMDAGVDHQPRGAPDLVAEHAEALVSALVRSEEHTSELQSLRHLVCRLLLEKKKNILNSIHTVSADCST